MENVMHRMSRRGLIGLAAVLALLTAYAVPGQPLPTAHAAVVPAGLPSHFGIGLAGSPDSSGIYGWMPSSSIPWDYSYQYLSGGVNTGAGWETWNASGQFALNYAQGADSHHYIPVFSYYEMLQSSGSCNSCGESQRDLTNLNTASVMQSYFANFTLLMQRLSAQSYGGITGFGKTAIVHIEPDLSGYAEQAVLNNGSCFGLCTGTGNNPALLKAAVASSGNADVAAFPNTYLGFNLALLHLRDLYAPNVLLAFHVSNWSAGTDISSNTSSSINATTLGQEAGTFAALSGITGLPVGVKGYDLIFNDVLDRDAAYYKYVYGNPNAFWDRLNVTFPNFTRWETYVHAINGTTGLPMIVWQVPEGNQYFDTENNTNNHYQDNRAEYFFGHIGELANTGIIGVLFGAGAGGPTVEYDGGDGITNPASFCTTDGISSGQICNNHVSTVSDDDGGYIRAQGQQYYAGGGYSLGGGTATPTATMTNTPVPATNTSTNTPTATSTPISTNTPVPATNTRTATSTPVSGTLTGASATTSGAIKLTTLGTTDWAHWGLTTTASFDHKAGVTSQIPTFTLTNGGTVGRAGLYTNHYMWSDGTATTSSSTPTGLYLGGAGHEFQLVLPADSTARTLKLYLGMNKVQAKLTVTLSDGSAAPFTDTVDNPTGITYRTYTLSYKAAGPGRTLTVTWSLQTDHGSGSVQLHAATLS
jgi:hypothetical protein